jgi:hypothetical protein
MPTNQTFYAGLYKLWALLWTISPAQYQKMMSEKYVDLPAEMQADVFEDVEKTLDKGLPTNTTKAKVKVLDLTVLDGYTDEVGFLLPCSTDKLVVLKSYEELYEQLVERNSGYVQHFSQERQKRPLVVPKRHVLLSGTPGIGKSCFLDFVLVKRLARRLPTAIQPWWCKGRGYFRFDNVGVHFFHTGFLYEEEPFWKDRSVWALVDDNPILEFCHQAYRDWLFLWTASPGKTSSSTWVKEVKADILYMDTWRWGEFCLLAER